VTQVVDLVKGIHALIPKAAFADTADGRWTLCDPAFPW